MAKNEKPPLWQSWAGVVSSLGLASILIVIIGRLWTRTYFDHFGLPSSGMDFSVYDFAFRSLEALIILLLGAVGFSSAWLVRNHLREWGFRTALLEVILVGILITCLLWVVPTFVPNSWLSRTGVLGLTGGLPLAAMLWVGVDIWVGPGGGLEKWPKWAREPTGYLLRRFGLEAEDTRDRAVAVLWKVLAVVLFLSVGFGYLPVASERLASTEAAADVATRRFAAAILESEDPLPDAIASAVYPTRSVPVRVILSRSENTYVLHSTKCTTIGELKVPPRVGGFLPPEAPEVCKVFAIPTARLMSIEYFQVGRAPANESPLRPVQVSLGEEPFNDLFSSGGASGEEELECETGSEVDVETHFHNSVWFEFTPPTNGAVLARVETTEFPPTIGIWHAPQGESPNLQDASGSERHTGLACEASWVIMYPEDIAADPHRKNAVGVVANVQAGTRYLAAVGAKEEGGGDGVVSFDFTPQAYFFSSARPSEERVTGEAGATPAGLETPGAGDLVPQVEIVSEDATARATLELWKLNRRTYHLEDGDPKELLPCSQPEERPLDSPCLRLESLPETSEGGVQARRVSGEGLSQGIWRLVVPTDFGGLARLKVAVDYPDLVLSFTDTADSPLADACVQRALILALDEGSMGEELGYEGKVIVEPEAPGVACQMPEAIEDAQVSALGLLEQAGVAEGFPIQIEAEDERHTLLAAAEIAQKRLLAIGLDATVEPCAGACIRASFRSDMQETGPEDER